MEVSFETRLSHLGFRRYRPSGILAEYVDCYWFIDCEHQDALSYREFLHPNGGMGIILNYGDPLYFDGERNDEPCILDGTSTISRRLSFDGRVSAVGIRFRPAGANHFFPLPLNELKNRHVRLADTAFGQSRDVYGAILKTSGDEARVAVIEAHLYRCMMTDRHVSEVVSQGMDLIRAHRGGVEIGGVAKHLGFDLRRMERLFNRQLGMTPKEYARALKVQVARHYLKQDAQRAYADIALDLGYYDQAHFNKQFKSVVGITPSEYRAIKRPTSA